MYYDPEGMSPGNREKFYEWYNNLVSLDYVFNSQADIIRYCQAHVDILRRCCLAFRQLFQQVTNVDRFAKCLTIASACNLVFRRTFLPENTIAVIPSSIHSREESIVDRIKAVDLHRSTRHHRYPTRQGPW